MPFLVLLKKINEKIEIWKSRRHNTVMLFIAAILYPGDRTGQWRHEESRNVWQ